MKQEDHLIDFILKKVIISHESTRSYMSNDRTLFPASSLKQNPCVVKSLHYQWFGIRSFHSIVRSFQRKVHLFHKKVSSFHDIVSSFHDIVRLFHKVLK